MTKVQIELPEATAKAAGAGGAPDVAGAQPIAHRRDPTPTGSRTHCARIADRVAEAGIEPMSMEDINAEVKAAAAVARVGGQ